jgi:hypothetical protein
MASYSVGISVSIAALPRHPSHSGNDVLHSLVVGFGWRCRPGRVGPVLAELHHVDEELSGPVVAGESPVGQLLHHRLGFANRFALAALVDDDRLLHDRDDQGG